MAGRHLLLPCRRSLTLLAAVALLFCACAAPEERPATVTPPPVAAPPVKAPEGPYDADLPAALRERLRQAGEGGQGPLLLAAADHVAAAGEVVKAHHFLARAAARFAAQGEGAGEAWTLVRRALLFAENGRSDEAGTLLREGWRRWGGSPLQAFPACLEGRLALGKGDLARARVHLRHAVEASETFRGEPYRMRLRREALLGAGVTGVLSRRLPELLSAYRRTEGAGTGGTGEGVALLREALALNRTLARRMAEEAPLEGRRCEAEALLFLGLEEGMAGAPGAAAGLQRAAALAGASGYREGEWLGLGFLAELGLLAPFRDEGRQAAQELLARSDGDPGDGWRVWARLLLARYAQAAGEGEASLRRLREADGIVTARSGGSLGMLEPLRRLQRRALYESLVEHLAERGGRSEALAAAETCRRLQALDLWEAAGGVPATTRGPRVQALEIPALQARLDGETTLFAFFATEKALYAWAIQQRQLYLVRLELTREALRGLVFALHEAVTAGNRRETENLSRRAYRELLQPVIPYVSGERIGFIPDDALAYLPFAALNYRGRWLVEGFALFHLPELSSLDPAAVERPPAVRRLLVLAAPQRPGEEALPRLREEGEWLGRRVPGATVLKGVEASIAGLKGALAGCDLLHLAARGRFDGAHPDRSGILLAPSAGDDGLLGPARIRALGLAVQGGFLSGCDPSWREDPEGRGLGLLQRAWLEAGGASVVTTLWLVEDTAAVRLPGLFYRHLARRDPPAEALRAAQRQLLREGHPPRLWAAFVLTGRP